MAALACVSVHSYGLLHSFSHHPPLQLVHPYSPLVVYFDFIASFALVMHAPRDNLITDINFLACVLLLLPRLFDCLPCTLHWHCDMIILRFVPLAIQMKADVLHWHNWNFWPLLCADDNKAYLSRYLVRTNIHTDLDTHFFVVAFVFYRFRSYFLFCFVLFVFSLNFSGIRMRTHHTSAFTLYE